MGWTGGQVWDGTHDTNGVLYFGPIGTHLYINVIGWPAGVSSDDNPVYPILGAPQAPRDCGRIAFCRLALGFFGEYHKLDTLYNLRAVDVPGADGAAFFPRPGFSYAIRWWTWTP